MLLTDITYVYYGAAQPDYLSCVKDASTREIIAHHLSTTMKMDIVYETLSKLSDSLNGMVHPEAIRRSHSFLSSVLGIKKPPLVIVS